MEKVKIFAFYLPQFHSIPENDEWWGKGFTEWRNVALSKPRFRGHDQPRIPEALGFYDLKAIDIHHQQAKLAKENGIDGFCYYHYWFNGKTLLETPLEVIRDNTSIDVKYMICWANENWTRRWDGKDQQVLIAQNYEDYNPNAHFLHMLKYFKDERYEKIDNKPVFVLYRANQIENLGEMIDVWDRMAIENGFQGIYFIAVSTTNIQDQRAISLGVKRIIDFQPSKNHPARGLNAKFLHYIASGVLRGELKIKLTRIIGGIEFAKIFNYKRLSENNINKFMSNEYISCIIPQWDNSARRKTDSTVIQNGDASLYGAWLAAAIKRTINIESPKYVFINAWNEWAEGCYLEPDLKNGDAFLLETKRVIDENRN